MLNQGNADFATAGAVHRWSEPTSASPAKPSPPADISAAQRPERLRIHYDASLIMHFGMETPVGLVRVDQYVAEYLARDPTLDLWFLVFDATLASYRRLTPTEHQLLRRILFHRYERSTIASPPPKPPSLFTARLLLRRLRTASTLDAPMFNHMLNYYLDELLPPAPAPGSARDRAARAARQTSLPVARCGHLILYRLTAGVRRALKIDRPAVSPPASDAVPSAEPIHFDSGSVLVSMGNSWDYLDYAYLHRICRKGGVRFVSVIYDVIAMEYPHTTPGPPHVYHRHWVELGHCAAHLLAISRFSAGQYREFIGDPNDLHPSMSHAYLPSVLRDRAGDIGETAVPQLLGRRFVVFCSTIETRKNHQLLLQLWDRLRLEFSNDQLPILVFVGRWGWGTEAVRLLSERNFRLRSRLLILDRTSDAELIWLYRNARFTVFPSLSEGYGLAAAESLSFGTPVVTANCPALLEATESLMPAYDPLDFVAWLAEMRQLIRDDARLDELKSAAARYRGPPYEAFADAIRATAFAVSEPCHAA